MRLSFSALFMLYGLYRFHLWTATVNKPTHRHQLEPGRSPTPPAISFTRGCTCHQYSTSTMPIYLFTLRLWFSVSYGQEQPFGCSKVIPYTLNHEIEAIPPSDGTKYTRRLRDLINGSAYGKYQMLKSSKLTLASGFCAVPRYKARFPRSINGASAQAEMSSTQRPLM